MEKKGYRMFLKFVYLFSCQLPYSMFNPWSVVLRDSRLEVQY
jgi:hypothetical protein